MTLFQYFLATNIEQLIAIPFDSNCHIDILIWIKILNLYIFITLIMELLFLSVYMNKDVNLMDLAFKKGLVITL